MYVNSNEDFQYQIAVLGLYSVDLKLRLKFSSSDPDDPKKQHLVIRGQSHLHTRASLPKKYRFTVGSDSDPLVKMSTTENEWSLGYTWQDDLNNRFPSFNQIFEGLLLEVTN